MSFESFKLDAKIMAGLKAHGYETPTPIQKQSIPHVMQGRDVLGLAQTGTGKTAAFALPILQRLLHSPARGQIRALVIAPTRELVDQIHSQFVALGRNTGLRSATVYGGVGMGPQISSLKGRAEIIIACPGRLLDHMEHGVGDFTKLEVLVLDEADHMFDMGFLPDVRKILKRLPHKRQNLLFSATMPESIRHLAHECLLNPVTVQVDHTVPLETVSHALYPVPPHLKTALLLELLRPTHMESVLVFTRTKHRAKRLDAVLKGAGFKATSLQGNLSQNRRKEAMDGFRDGRFDIMVATDIAARGIDVSQISHVINFDIPGTPEAYTHRIGRTGRAAKTGDAYTFVSQEDDGMVREIERRMGNRIERRKLEGFDYTKAASNEHSFKRGPHAQQQRHSHAPRHGNSSSHSHSRPGAPVAAGSGQPSKHTWGNRHAKRLSR